MRRHEYPGFRPTFDTLEDRTLLASGLTASVTGGILRIQGTEAADRITLRQVDYRLRVDGITIRENGVQVADLDARRVYKVEIDARGGNDIIELDSERYAGQQPLLPWAQVYCGAGNDVVLGTYGADIIYGGAGNDWLIGGGGNDLLFGEDGDDELYGGAANDWLWGGNGNDRLYGGLGDDWMFGQNGRDYLDGASGADVFEGGNDFDSYKDQFDLSRPVVQGMSVADILQNRSPICQTLSALGAAVTVGWDLNSQLHYQGKGTWKVDVVYHGPWYQETVQFDGSWNDNDPSPGRDSLGRNNGEFWPILFQRARLQQFGVPYQQELTQMQWEQYNSASRGRLLDPGEALYTFTGAFAQYILASQAQPESLRTALLSGRPIVLTTTGSLGNSTLDSGSGIVSGHAYVLVDIYQASGTWMLRIYNPWGVDGNGAPRDGVDDGFLTITWAEFIAFYRSVRIG